MAREKHFIGKSRNYTYCKAQGWSIERTRSCQGKNLIQLVTLQLINTSNKYDTSKNYL